MTTRFSRCEHCFRADRPPKGNCPRCNFTGRPGNVPPVLPEGTVIGGFYMLGREEGKGGFSICYRAWDSKNETIVAVKELFPNRGATRDANDRVVIESAYRQGYEAALQSAIHEAEVLRQLADEPATVHVCDVVPANGTLYLVMEFLRGRSYDRYLRDYHHSHQQHVPGAAVNVALVVLGALGSVHERKLLHLDVKPANIRVLDGGRIVLLDFGSTRNAFHTRDGRYGVTYTPPFAAPEQHAADGVSSEATDIYGVGVVLYFSLTLRLPPEAPQRRSDELTPSIPALNPAVPPELNAVIEKAMALDPRDRYASVEEFRAALKPFRGLGIEVPMAAPMASERIAAGVIDIAIAGGLVAAAQLFSLPPDGNALTTAVLLWWLMQLLPRWFQATPGMALLRLRLISLEGELTLPTLLLRTMSMIWSVISLRFRIDEKSMMPHDISAGTKVVRRKAIVKVLPSLADSGKQNSLRG